MARVLIIEDEELIAVMLVSLIRKFGHEPLDPVAYGEEVMRRIKESSPDLLLVDIKLKGEMDGIDTVIELKKEYDMPFVYMTGNSDENTRKRAMDTEPDGYLNKPFVEEEWKAVINKALGR